MKQKVQDLDEELGIVYRKNLLLKQELESQKKKQEQLEEQLIQLNVENGMTDNEKKNLNYQLKALEDRYQKELSEMKEAHDKATEALEMMTMFQPNNNETADGEYIKFLILIAVIKQVEGSRRTDVEISNAVLCFGFTTGFTSLRHCAGTPIGKTIFRHVGVSAGRARNKFESNPSKEGNEIWCRCSG